MKDVKDDRRVKYTKMVLKESFINLLEKRIYHRLQSKKSVRMLILIVPPFIHIIPMYMTC